MSATQATALASNAREPANEHDWKGMLDLARELNQALEAQGKKWERKRKTGDGKERAAGLSQKVESQSLQSSSLIGRASSQEPSRKIMKTGTKK